ncbi:hypothetical protein CELD12_15480 [Cellulomonas sp. NTE-D12]|nr:hypothetical protein CELD12_15480 [Cellulomonas sp. NTE-D12]
MHAGRAARARFCGITRSWTFVQVPLVPTVGARTQRELGDANGHGVPGSQGENREPQRLSGVCRRTPERRVAHCDEGADLRPGDAPG